MTPCRCSESSETTSFGQKSFEVEVWVTCPGHAGIYEVSNLGRVKRVAPWKGTRAGRIMKLTSNKLGYKYLSLTIDGVSRTHMLHQLVCLAFHGDPPTPDHEAAHNNGETPDCRAENLRWATHAENMADKNAHGTHNKGEAHVLAVLKDEDIPRIRSLLAEGVYQKDVAKFYGVHRSTINNIANGKNWTHV